MILSPYRVIIYLWNDFFQKTILNAKVNNCRVELSDYNMKFKFITGDKNTLDGTLSRLNDLELTELNLPIKGYK